MSRLCVYVYAGGRKRDCDENRQNNREIISSHCSGLTAKAGSSRHQQLVHHSKHVQKHDRKKRNTFLSTKQI